MGSGNHNNVFSGSPFPGALSSTQDRGAFSGNIDPIRLSSEESGSVSVLSNIFIDYYMPDADGAFVKVYLYLLRCLQANRSVSIPEIADRLSCTDNDVSRAIRYWIGKGILQLKCNDDGTPSGIVLCHLTAPESLPGRMNILDFQIHSQPAGASEPETAEICPPAFLPTAESGVSAKSSPEPQKSSLPDKSTPSVEMLGSALLDESFMDLTSQAEAYFKRPLADEDINALWRIYGDLKLPFEVCEYLLIYCASERDNHPERILPAYYEKVARNWKEHGIRTQEDAKQFTQDFFFGTKLLRALGIRNRYVPTDAENRLLADWRDHYHFTDEMLLLACERAVLRKPGAGLGYVGGILESWYRQGITTPEDVMKKDSAKVITHKNFSGNGNASGINDFMKGNLSEDDLDMIEQLSINRKRNS